VATITVLGYLAQLGVGCHLFGNVGRVLNVIPLVSTIYGALRTVADSLVDRETCFQSVVFVETPRDGLYSIGLVRATFPIPPGRSPTSRSTTCTCPTARTRRRDGSSSSPRAGFTRPTWASVAGYGYC